MRSRRRLAFAMLSAATLTAALIAACGLDLEGGPAGPPDAMRDDVTLPPSGDGGELDAPTTPDGATPDALDCDSGRGPSMVAVADNAFCIDTSEVTNAQYNVFLSATGGGRDAGFLDGGWPSGCARDPFGPYGKAGLDAGPASEPVTAVSWCDAYAFCKWADKRLCTGPAKSGSVPKGEWLAACTRSGERSLPNAPPDAAACNIAGTGPTAAKSLPDCEGGYAGVFDMLGNVEEWVDECTGSTCSLYGASWSHPAFAAKCAAVEVAPMNLYLRGLGFRCCR